MFTFVPRFFWRGEKVKHRMSGLSTSARDSDFCYTCWQKIRDGSVFTIFARKNLASLSKNFEHQVHEFLALSIRRAERVRLRFETRHPARLMFHSGIDKSLSFSNSRFMRFCFFTLKHTKLLYKSRKLKTLRLDVSPCLVLGHHWIPGGPDGPLPEGVQLLGWKTATCTLRISSCSRNLVEP